MRTSRRFANFAPVLMISLAFSVSAIAQNAVKVGPVITKTGVQSSVIDTSTFVPQITQSFSKQLMKPENPMARLLSGPANGLKAGQMMNLKRSTTQSKWPAIGATGWVPPDCTMAVGPNHIVATVNSDLAFFDKQGNKQFQTSAQTFFAGLGATNFQFDPRVIYDRIHQRFVIIYDEEDDTTTTSKILLAVSDDSDPNGTWYRYRFEAKINTGGNDYWLDYPGFGYNKDGWIITGNMFGFSVNLFAGAQVMVIPSAPTLTGAVAKEYQFLVNRPSFQVAEMLDPNANVIYIVDLENSSSMNVLAAQNITTTPTFAITSVSVPSFSFPSNDARSTNGNTLDSLDGRLYGVSCRNGKLVTSHTVQPSGLAARWYQISMNNWPTSGTISLAQSGEIKDATNDYHMPSVNQNAAGDISMIFTRSSPSITADIVISTRIAADPPGVMGLPTLLESSVGNNYSYGRWGDYFACRVDPVDDKTFWGIGMDVASDNNWKTSIFSWTATTGEIIPPAPTTLRATGYDSKVLLTWSGNAYAATYNLKRAIVAGGPYDTIKTGLTKTSTYDTNVVNNTRYYYVVTAQNNLGESGNSNEVSAVPYPGSAGLILNPGFENGNKSAPWIASPGVINNLAIRPAHNGTWKAWLGGYGAIHSDFLYQQITIPDGISSAVLSFSLRIDTAENIKAIATDTLQVQIRSTSGAVLATLGTYSNMDANKLYLQKTYDVSSFAGQTIRVYLVSQENGTKQTSFVVDDFSLYVN